MHDREKKIRRLSVPWYRNVYGEFPPSGLPVVNTAGIAAPQPLGVVQNAPFLGSGLIISAPLWHDWAKPIGFQ